MTDSTLSSGTVSPAGGRLVAFLGRRGPLFGILLINTLLGIITLGIYRFWARTRLRRYFWSAIEVAGEPLEYTGRGMELFIGFLIVIAVLIPVFGVFSILLATLHTVAPDVSDALTFVFYLVLFWLGQYAFFRARRYRLARTVWRGIRAGQDGSAASYAWLRFGYAILSVITLGWAVPWMTAESQRYEVENARFGVENFRYDGKGRDLLGRWAPCGIMITIAIVGAIAATVMNFADLQALSAAAEQAETGRPKFDPQLGLRLLSAYAVPFIAYLLAIFLFIYYRIGALRYMISQSNLSAVSFTSEFSGWRVVGYGVLSTVVAGALIAVLIFAVTIFFSAATVIADGELSQQDKVGLSAFATFVPILFLLIIMPMVNFLLFYYPVIRHIATTLRLSEISSLENIVQSSKQDPRFGEGLAAALDIDVGGF